MIRATHGIIQSQQATGTAFPFTDDFIAATGIGDAGIISDLQTMEADLTSNSFITYGGVSRIKALWPVVGGTAATHSYNFINPAAFQLLFSGTWAHTATGMQPSGGYADTQFAPATELTENSTTIGFYSRTNDASTGVDMGVVNIGLGGTLAFFLNYAAGGVTYSRHYSPQVGNADTSSLGLYLDTRTAANDHRVFKAGTQIGATDTGATAGFANLTFNLYIGAFNNSGSAGNYSTRECATALVTDGLTPAEAATLSTIIQNFQIGRGRAV